MFTWTGKIDSKGRITIPARIRDKLGFNKGDQVSLRIGSKEIVWKQVKDGNEALEIIKDLNSVESFNYSDGILEVVLNG